MHIETTSLSGLLLIHLDVFADDRGSFREAWQAEKMRAVGLPDLQPVQWNVSVSKYGVVRGIHAEPWEKYIHVTHGTAFAAIVDLREDSETFGKAATFNLDHTKALFLSKGFGNSFQATSDIAVYNYLVTAHWQAGLTYIGISHNDPDININWPIAETILSDKDAKLPTLRDVYPDKFKNS